jgi:hypothetical protein
MKGCDRGKLNDILKAFARRVEALADRTPDVPKLLERIERELQRALEAQITRIL